MRTTMTTPLEPVDRLIVTFLVDNSIEWMTKLPPGFTHELSQHIRYHSPVVDETTGVPILDFNNFCCGAHGFSALIETHIDGGETHLTLFDSGPDSQSLVRNISAMHVPIELIERVVISHWHSDHTDRPSARGIAPGPLFDRVLCSLPRDPSFDAIAHAGGTIETHKDGHAVAGSTIWVSGEIPRVTEFEAGMLGGMRWVPSTVPDLHGEWAKEQHIMDERYAAIDVAGKGLVIFSACSHAGIVNVIKDAIATFSRPIYMVIGGLHLAGPEFAPRLPPTIEFLSRQLRPSPTYILPMHCSGFHSKVALEAEFGEGCVPAGVGLKVEITGDRQKTTELLPPVY